MTPLRISIKGPLIFTLGLVGSMAASEPLPISEVDMVYPFIPDWEASRILHFGDSHVASGLKSTLARYFREAGATFRQEGWAGSRSKSWIASGRLKKLVSAFRPTVVLVTLGTNEMTTSEPMRHRNWIRAIIRRLKGTVCYWMGPPPLIDDKYGYNEMAEEAVKPCRYFDSRILDMKPRKDGTFHLTRKEGVVWGDKVWHWMNGE